ncbi:hypothetical protein EDD86DRAFT_274457 [Gorgonomyces haynaldii]|nr:hypothetical protein EDD86DRAFT_274457 [Gorgonomyces haynaldii]
MDLIPDAVLEDLSVMDGKKKKKTPEQQRKPRTAKPQVSEMLQQVKIDTPLNPTDLAFVYEPPTNPVQPPSGDAIDPQQLQIVAAVSEQPQATTEKHHLKPTTRKEVALLRNTMIKLLHDIGVTDDSEYPTEMHAFVDVIQNEQKIYDSVFMEIIRQVTTNMIERGEVLAEIRRRYANMFVKIPRHVKHLHTELIAQRKLNRRLSEELIRARETIKDLLQELEFVREHDNEATKQAQDAQEKLVSVLTQSDNTDEVLEEYHKLYRMQRDRLENSIRISEQEKRMWIDAATHLAMRIGNSMGTSELSTLQRDEQVRLRYSTHIIVKISDANELELNQVEREIDEWRSKLTKLSHNVIEDDRKNMDRLAKMQREIKMMIKNIVANDPIEENIQEHPLLNAFYLYDLKSIVEYLNQWADEMSVLVVRFTSDRDVSILEDIVTIRRMTQQWIEKGSKLLKRNEKTTNGKDYVQLSNNLNALSTEIEEWLNKLELRVSGDDGTAAQIITLQNQIDDRTTSFSAKDQEKPLLEHERLQLKEVLVSWTDMIGNLINIYSNTTEREQHKVPLHVENWVSRVLDHMNTDTDIRNEDNMKLHTSIVNWMVQLLVREGKPKTAEESENDFQILHNDLLAFNTNLLYDAVDIDLLSDENKDLRKQIHELTANWVQVARRYLLNQTRYG